MRIVFMGTPDFAVPALAAIAGHGHEVAAVYTQPPRAAGRGMAERRSPVHALANGLALPVRTPASLKDAAARDGLAAVGADALVVVAYGLILPRAVLDAAGLGAYNIHASLLPRWRGAAPIQRAIMAGDEETGVAVMRMEEGLDTGAVCMEERLTILSDMTAGELHDRLAAAGADLIIRALGALERGQLDCAAQGEDGVTYAAKISNEETRIDFSRPAADVHNHIRGLSPFPGAWCEMELGGRRQRIKVLRSAPASGSGPPGRLLDDALTVACGSGAVRLLELQRAGGQAMGADDFRRGAQLNKGAVLS